MHGDKGRRTIALAAAGLFLLTLSACDRTGSQEGDASAGDASTLDSGTVDAGMADGSISDGGSTDAPTTDGPSEATTTDATGPTDASSDAIQGCVPFVATRDAAIVVPDYPGSDSGACAECIVEYCQSSAIDCLADPSTDAGLLGRDGGFLSDEAGAPLLGAACEQYVLCMRLTYMNDPFMPVDEIFDRCQSAALGYYGPYSPGTVCTGNELAFCLYNNCVTPCAVPMK